MGVQFGRPAGDIDGVKRDSGSIAHDLINRGSVHVLGTVRPSFQMTMSARLIAEKPQVYLQGMGMGTDKFKIGLGERGFEGKDRNVPLSYVIHIAQLSFWT